MMTATITLDVPDLPENDIWFANAQAWTTYWNDIAGVVAIDEITTSLYVPVAFDSSIQDCLIDIDGAQYTLVTVAKLTSLVNTVAALDTAFQSMRTAMRDAGLISNAQ